MHKTIWCGWNTGFSRSMTPRWRFINRGHTLKDFEDAVAMTRGRGIRICAHVILGLPGETRDMMLDTARYLADSGIDGSRSTCCM